MQVIQTMAQPRRTSKQSKQSGGTFLGIVLGLIVGLAIAVVVALYITRAPTPFVSKVAPPSASDTAASNAPYDPNRVLQGSSPGQAVAPPQAGEQTAPPNTAPGQTGPAQQPGLLDEPQIVEVPASGASGTAATSGNGNGVAVAPSPATGNGTAAQQPQTGSAPTNNVPPKVASGAAQPASGADANTGYFLQVGAYKTAADAEQQRARLAFQGFESKVTERDAGGITYFRVRIGPFSKFDDMNNARQRLSDAGIDTAVIRFSKQ
ncbi:cell division protein [Burkholderia sp. WAC0059]|uniref:SPOR domain-containing protein n=1 Tax=Burkholderia sp. WAC0059 TaxID=2066022 RepID=UPI000C7F6362|nr:SPOR domain-containing protein [Burkholderia sp. WAC0059]PLZ02239.1 cell division protein [Burkholderia sp. WAC0059]